MRTLLLSWFIIFCCLTYGQLPSVNVPLIPAVDTIIYLSPNGSDANPGTTFAPKLTFQAALNAIPYGTAGVNGNAVYGKIILLAGNYYPSPANYFSQSVANWRSTQSGQYVYRNVSVEGEGEVNMYGDNCPNGHVLELRGNGISVKNIKVWNADVNGIWIHGDESNLHHDVALDHVEAYHCNEFGVFVNGYNRVSIDMSIAGNNCLHNEFEDTCKWASGMRTDHCKHVSIRNSEAYNNWGEGINPSLSEFVEIKDNKIYNNYSVNLYFHSTSNAVVCNNLIYSDDSTYWRYCLNGGGKPGGIDITNELDCEYSCFQQLPCGQSYACCAYYNDNDALTFSNYKLVDSLFIFNNVCINSKLTIYDTYSQNIIASNYFGKIFIENNDFIGTDAAVTPLKSSLTLYFPLANVSVQPVIFKNNIFSYNNQQPNSIPLYYTSNNTCDGSNIHSKFTFQNNLWKFKPNVAQLNFTADQENNNITGWLPVTSLSNLTPSLSSPELVQTGVNSAYITEDYYHNPRSLNSNVGAIEYGSFNEINTLSLSAKIYPNPSEHTLNVERKNQSESVITISSLNGVLLARFETNKTTFKIDLSHYPAGTYLISVDESGILETHRFIKL